MRKEKPPVSLFSPFPGKQRPLGKNSRGALPLAAVKKENTFTLKTENKNRNTATAVVVLAVAAVLLAIDQMLKYFVLRDLRPVGTVTVIPGLLELTYVENTGAAFGLFKQVMWLVVAVTVVATVAIIVLLFRYKRHSFFSYTTAALLMAENLLQLKNL